MACKISVVVATFNAGQVLRATLTSLREQTFRDFEVILADGASTDKTVDVAREFSDLDMTVFSAPDEGIADAWNKGVRRARGEWIIFLNAGDFLNARHFERAAAACGVVAPRTLLYCDVQKVSAGGRLLHRIRGTNPSLATIKKGSVGFGHPGSLAPRSAFAEVGEFSLKCRVAMDTDFILRCFHAGFAFARFDSCAYMAEGGVSESKFGLAMREFFVAAEHLGLVTRRERWLRASALAVARPVYRLGRRVVSAVGRPAKHVLVSLMNVVPAVLWLASLRRIYYRLLGFSIGSSVSIGMGTRFYRTRNVRIGDRSVVNRNCLIDNRAPIDIGSDVSISRDVHIYTAGHDLASPFFEMTVAPVSIGDHAVIFARATIMPGVSIGRGAVVYPGAVVSRHVPERAVVAGVPARIVGQRAANPQYSLDYEFPLAQ